MIAITEVKEHPQANPAGAFPNLTLKIALPPAPEGYVVESSYQPYGYTAPDQLTVNDIWDAGALLRVYQREFIKNTRHYPIFVVIGSKIINLAPGEAHYVGTTPYRVLWDAPTAVIRITEEEAGPDAHTKY
ncbi:MAG: hypothetical protein QXM12_00590 [Nitrososphaerota archaeon]